MAYEGPHPFPVKSGGTGDSSFTAYSVVCGGTTSTGPLQNVSGIGSSGQVLTSNGAAALPSWQSGSTPAATCAFSVFLTTTISNATGDGTNALIIYDTKRFDIGNNYNTGTGLFTAPVTGHYLFAGDAHLVNLSAGVTATLGHLAVNGTLTYRFFEIDKGSSGTLTGASGALVVALNAGDTFSVYVSATGGTKTAGITGSSGPLCANFLSGVLLF